MLSFVNKICNHAPLIWLIMNGKCYPVPVSNALVRERTNLQFCTSGRILGMNVKKKKKKKLILSPQSLKK
jgi:hypothetical protein